MGSGTEVAKEAGDIVILDDNFLSIKKAILYGRTIYNSICKFITFQLTINFSAVVINLVAPFIGIEKPLTITQILWINLIMDTMINMVKAAAVPTFITQAQKYVETGNFAKLNEQNDGQVIVASVAERTGLMTMEFKGIEKTSRNKDEALVTIKIWDQQLEKNFELQLKMKQLDDGT